MIKHIVMFKLKERSPENIQKAVTALESMRGRIEPLLHLEIGLDFYHSERSFDLVITTHFNDKSALDNYATHPHHQPVIQTMRELCERSIVVDYETP